MSSELSSLNRFELLKQKVLQHKRNAGIYILEAMQLPSPLPSGVSVDSIFRAFAASHGFGEPEICDAEWKCDEVFRGDARQRIADALKGGPEIGHSDWDVPPETALDLAEEFISLFGEDARFYCNGAPTGDAQILAPYGRPDFMDFIFSGGCVAADQSIAAIFWMLDND